MRRKHWKIKRQFSTSIDLPTGVFKVFEIDQWSKAGQAIPPSQFAKFILE